jgi:hypothetical protein
MTEHQTETNPAPDAAAQSDAAIRDSMESVFNNLEKREAAEAKTAMPTREGESVEQTYERAYDWAETSKTQQKRENAEWRHDQALKAEAKERGLTVDQLATLRQSETTQHYQKSMDKALSDVQGLRDTYKPVAQYYPGQTVGQITQGYVQLEQAIRANPVQGIAHLATQLGIDPRQLGAALYQGGPTADDVANAQIVAQFIKSNPEADAYRYEIAGLLMRGEIQESGDWQKDLREALRIVRQGGKEQTRSRRRDRSTRATMEAVYNKNHGNRDD